MGGWPAQVIGRRIVMRKFGQAMAVLPTFILVLAVLAVFMMPNGYSWN